MNSENSKSTNIEEQNNYNSNQSEIIETANKKAEEKLKKSLKSNYIVISIVYVMIIYTFCLNSTMGDFESLALLPFLFFIPLLFIISAFFFIENLLLGIKYYLTKKNKKIIKNLIVLLLIHLIPIIYYLKITRAI